METKRRKFQGVINILSFNRHFYITGIAVFAALVISQVMIHWAQGYFWLIIAAFLYGFLMPLFVSAYVYDFSGFYHLNWLKEIVKEPQEISSMVNINAGFDETSFIIKEKFPQAHLQVFDFYDPVRHTEPAIKRARKVTMMYPNTRNMATNALPLEDKSVDLVFLISAVHEIRSNPEKAVFLKECHRVCKPGGLVIMVEHLRDFPNFLAFTIGFTHFFSRSVWKNAFKEAGFPGFRETKFTPFMSVFHCRP